jgi:hypothetical protein
VAYFAGAEGLRLCPDRGGILNPQNSELVGMESRTHPVRLEAQETAFRGPDLLTAEEAAVLLRGTSTSRRTAPGLVCMKGFLVS